MNLYVGLKFIDEVGKSNATQNETLNVSAPNSESCRDSMFSGKSNTIYQTHVIYMI